MKLFGLHILTDDALESACKDYADKESARLKTELKSVMGDHERLMGRLRQEWAKGDALRRELAALKGETVAIEGRLGMTGAELAAGAAAAQNIAAVIAAKRAEVAHVLHPAPENGGGDPEC